MNSSVLLNDYPDCKFTNGIIRYFGTFIFLIGILSTVFSICVFARKPLRKSFKKIFLQFCLLLNRTKIMLLLFSNISNKRFNTFINNDY
jgi:hypothetical protein